MHSFMEYSDFGQGFFYYYAQLKCMQKYGNFLYNEWIIALVIPSEIMRALGWGAGYRVKTLSSRIWAPANFS